MLFAEVDEACPHAWDEAAMLEPRTSATVHRDECAYCCRTCRHGDGVYVCMACYAGFCAEHVAKHMSLKPTHTMYTRLRELPEEKTKEEVRDVNYLGTVAPKVYESQVCCAACALRFRSVPEIAAAAYNGIIHAPVPGAVEHSSAAGEGLLQKPLCPHLISLEQTPSPYAATGHVPSSQDACDVDGCGCTVNNWMCVTCGAIGCPRPEAGGKGHALLHHSATGHPCTVKLGTVTPEGADFYCYECDDDVADAHFAAHMAHFGIDVTTATKTAKTMGELAYDYSTQFDFSKITEAGTDLEPAFGPARTGIRNIGNSCYIASVVQCLMSLQPFQRAFYVPLAMRDGEAHQPACTADPYKCRTCQTERVAAGLFSGEFSQRDVAEELNGIIPRLFKNVYAQQHPDFSSAGQQDAQEYFQYLLEEMRRYVKPPVSFATCTASGDACVAHPVQIFDFLTEHRVQCANCHKVRYSLEKESSLSLSIPVDEAAQANATTTTTTTTLSQDDAIGSTRPRCTLEQCLRLTTEPHVVTCRCDACGQSTEYSTTMRLASFPDVLVLCPRRAYFDTQSLSVRKLDVYVEVPQEINIEGYKGGGLQSGEEAMPPAISALATLDCKRGRSSAAVDEMALATVVSMGIETNVAHYALQQTDMNVERAIDYIFSHPDLAQEISLEQQAEADRPESTSMSPSVPCVATDGAGLYELVAMISHMGAGAKSGHYVCHVRDAATGRWLLFNDEKVGFSQEPPFSMAMMYFFQRKSV